MIPKHANPYLLKEQTTVVSRAALREDSDDEPEPPTMHPERAQMLARLESILKRSIEDVLPLSTQSGNQEDGDAPRKKKRRKVEEPKVDKPEEPVAVRTSNRLSAPRAFSSLSG